MVLQRFVHFLPDELGISTVTLSELERRGVPIGPLDTLIAAQCLRLKVPLVTNNTKEFLRIAGLQLEDWVA